MLNYFKISFGIFLALAASRFIPHPPNFTSLLALSFYVPSLLGVRFIPSLVIGFIVTDLIIGFHNVTLFTWGSVILIGFMSKHFLSTTISRISGALLGACIFFIVTNFGVWSLGSYGYTFDGFLNCYVMAIPFFGNTIIGTLIFSIIFELIITSKRLYLEYFKPSIS